MTAEWQNLASCGQTVEAIKAYRSSSAVGLAEAKAAVERWLDINLPPSPDYKRAVRVGTRIADRLDGYAARTGRRMGYWIQVLPASPDDIQGRSDILFAALSVEDGPLDLHVVIELPGVPSGLRRQSVIEQLNDGVRLVWVVELDVPTVRVITDPEEHRFYHPGATFDGGDILPGFSCKVADLFG